MSYSFSYSHRLLLTYFGHVRRLKESSVCDVCEVAAELLITSNVTKLANVLHVCVQKERNELYGKISWVGAMPCSNWTIKFSEPGSR